MNPNTKPNPSPPSTAAAAEGTAGPYHLIAAYLHLVGASADVERLARHDAWPPEGPAPATLVQSLLALGLDCRYRCTRPRQLIGARLPALARSVEGEWLLIGQADKEGVLLQAGHLPAQRLTWAEFAVNVPPSGRLEWLTAQPDPLAAARADIASGPAFGIGWFWSALRPYRGLLAEVLLASFFVQVLALLAPLIFQVVIDKVLTQRSMATLDVMVLALLGCGFFEVVLGAMRHYLFTHTTHRVDVELGAKLFRHLMHLPLSYFETRRSGDTVARLREMENARSFMTGAALTSGLDLLFAVVFLGVMFYYSVTLSLIVVAASPVFFAASWLLTPLMRKKLEDRFALGAENQSFLVETVTAMETLKSHAVEAAWQREWERKLCHHVRAAFESGHLAQAANQVTGLAGKVLTVLLLYFGALQVMGGELSVGGLIAFNMLAVRVNAPILKLASLWQEFTQMKVSVRRLGDIMNARPEPAFRPGRSTPPATRGHISLQDVSFGYGAGAPPVIRDLSLELRAGEIVGITGVSGAGKTTLMRLIQRLHVPQTGKVLLDGMDLGAVDTLWLRRQIGVVGQDTALFNRSVRENIALGDPGLPMEAVVASAQLAGAHEFIAQLPDGYDTIVGERGSRLSGGQRARIAIARALVANPRILLLDEATASLDYESERVIHDNMERICAGRTVLIVAHRLSTLRMASRVLVLHEGRLIESGPHRDLIRAGGRYASLYQAHRVLEAA